MHTVERLEAALCVAQRVGYRIRQEWLGGSGGGGCQIKGTKWIFLDLAVGPEEQLDAVLEVLRGEPQAAQVATAEELRFLLATRQVA